MPQLIDTPMGKVEFPDDMSDEQIGQAVAQNSFNTKLNDHEEEQFEAWKQQYAPKDSGVDYDLRGAFKAGLTPAENGHWPDTYKKPNHPTFSNQSIYATGEYAKHAGTWDGETYIPAGATAPEPKAPLSGAGGSWDEPVQGPPIPDITNSVEPGTILSLQQIRENENAARLQDAIDQHVKTGAPIAARPVFEAPEVHWTTTGPNAPEISAAVEMDDNGKLIPRDLSAKFNPESFPYAVVYGKILIDPKRYREGVEAATLHHDIDQPTSEKLLAQAPEIEKAVAERAKLEADAGSNPELKAALVGAGRGGAMIGAGAGAGAAGMRLGPIPGVIAGAAGAIGGGLAYDQALKRLAPYNDLINSARASSQIEPAYTQAGELASFLIPVPSSIARLGRAAEVVNVARGGTEAAKFVAGQVAKGAAVGAGIDTVLQGAFMAAGQPYDPKSLGFNTVVGGLLSGHGIKFTNYDTPEVADIVRRGIDGGLKTAAERDVFDKAVAQLNSLATKGGLPADTAKIEFSGQQVQGMGKPSTILETRIAPESTKIGGPDIQPTPTPPAEAARAVLTPAIEAAAEHAPATAAEAAKTADLIVAKVAAEKAAADAKLTATTPAKPAEVEAPVPVPGQIAATESKPAEEVMAPEPQAGGDPSPITITPNEQNKTESVPAVPTPESGVSVPAKAEAPAVTESPNVPALIGIQAKDLPQGNPLGLRVAVRKMDKSISIGKPGDLHMDIPYISGEEPGFALPDGTFLTREEAAIAQQQATPVPAGTLQPPVGGQAQLQPLPDIGTTSKEGLKGTKATRRITNAEESFISFAMETAGLTRPQAETALASYRKNKAIKIDPIGGQYSFTHGGFAEPETLRRAAEEQPNVPHGTVQKPKRTFKRKIPQAPNGVPDLIDILASDIGQIQHPETARKAQLAKEGKTPFQKTTNLGGEFDGWMNLPPLLRKLVFNPASTVRPDGAAQAAYDAGLISQPTPDALREALLSAWQTRLNFAKGERMQAHDEKLSSKEASDFQKDAITLKTAKTDNAIPSNDLQVGDVVKVGDEELKVTDIDPDTFAVTLEDGKKYGVQIVAGDEVIYGEIIEKSEVDPVTDWPTLDTEEKTDGYIDENELATQKLAANAPESPERTGQADQEGQGGAGAVESGRETLSDDEYFGNILRTAADKPSDLRAIDVDRIMGSVKPEEVSDFRRWLRGHKDTFKPDTLWAIETWQPEDTSGSPEGYQPPQKPRGDPLLARHVGKYDEYQATKAEYAKAFEKWLDSIPTNKAIIFKRENFYKSGKSTSYSAVTKDPKGGWRVTSFDENLEMPWGHQEYKTRLESAKEMQGWTRIERLPFQVKAGEFHAQRTPFVWLTRPGQEPLHVRFGGYMKGGERAQVLDEHGGSKEWMEVSTDDLSLHKNLNLPTLEPGKDQGDLLSGGDVNTGKVATITNEDAGTLARIGGQVVAKVAQNKAGAFVADFNDAGKRLTPEQRTEVNRAAIAYTKKWQAAKIREGTRKPLAATDLTSQTDLLESGRSETPLFETAKPKAEPQSVMGETVIKKDWTDLSETELPPLDRELTDYSAWRRDIAKRLLPDGTNIQREAVQMELSNAISKETAKEDADGKPKYDQWQTHIVAQRIAAQLLTGEQKEILAAAKDRALNDEYSQWDMGMEWLEGKPAKLSVEAYEKYGRGRPLPDGFVKEGDSYVFKSTEPPEPKFAPVNQGDPVTFTPTNPKRHMAVTGIVQDVLNDGKLLNIFTPTPTDPTRTLRVSAMDGTVAKAVEQSAPLPDIVLKFENGTKVRAKKEGDFEREGVIESPGPFLRGEEPTYFVKHALGTFVYKESDLSSAANPQTPAQPKAATAPAQAAGELPWPDGTRFIDADGQFVVFKDRDNRTISRQKVGNSAHAIGVAERLTNELRESKKAAKLERTGSGGSAANQGAPEAIREPWQRTMSDFLTEEFRKETGLKSWTPDKGTTNRVRLDTMNKIIGRHKRSVQEAIRDGKPVPPEVLADYPDLSPDPAQVRTAYDAAVAKSELKTGDVAIADVARELGITDPAQMRALVEQLWKDGQISSLDTGDSSLSDERVKSFGVPQPGGMGKTALVMRMASPSHPKLEVGARRHAEAEKRFPEVADAPVSAEMRGQVEKAWTGLAKKMKAPALAFTDAQGRMAMLIPTNKAEPSLAKDFPIKVVFPMEEPANGHEPELNFKTIPEAFDSLSRRGFTVDTAKTNPHLESHGLEAIRPAAPGGETPEVTPRRAGEPLAGATEAEIAQLYVKAHDDAERIAGAVARGHGDIIFDAAFTAARDNAEGSIRAGKQPSMRFMRLAAKSATKEAIQKQAASMESTAPGSTQTLGEKLTSSGASPAEQAGASDQMTRLREAAAKLPASQRKIAEYLLDHPGASNAEIAEATGIAPGSVATIKVAARRAMLDVENEDMQGAVEPGTANPDDITARVEKASTLDEEKQSKADNATAGASGGALLTPSVSPSAPIIPLKSVSQIIRDLAKGLGVPIRFGRLTTAKFGGYFKSIPNLIGSKRANDLPIVTHEAGHKIDSMLSMSKNVGIRSELELLGDPTTPGSRSSWTKSKTLKYKRGEGVAEFIRYWLTDPAEAARLAPKTSVYFEGALAANPDLADTLRTAQRDIQMWRTAPEEARLDSAISVGENPNKTRYGFNQLTRDLVDDLHFIRLAVDDAQKLSGSTLAPSRNPYLLARLLRGSYGMAGTFIQEGPVNFKTRDVDFGKGLADALEPVSGRIDEFRRWIVAKQAKELHGQGKETGLDRGDVNTVAAKYDADPAFIKAFNRLKAWNDSLLQYAVDAGYVSEDGAAAMRKMNQDYVPLHRVFEIGAGEDPSQQGAGPGRGLNVGKTGSVRGRHGSTRDIVDPLETMVKNAYSIITASEKNAINAAIADMATLPGMGKWVERVAAPKEVVKVGIEDIRKELEAAGADLTNVPDDLLMTFFRAGKQAPFGENIIKVNRGGELEFYRLKKELFDTFHALDLDDSTTLIRILSSPAQILRAGVTLTPDFALANVMRDAFSSAVINKYGMLPFEASVRGAAAMIGNPELVAEWAASGGENSIEASFFDRSKTQAFLRERITKDMTPAERALVFVKSPLTALRLLSGGLESATRIGEYQRAYNEAIKDGMNPGDARRKAAFESRDRQDFAKGGAKTKILRHLAAFWNAGLQANIKLIQRFRESPIRTTLQGLAFITSIKMVEQALNWDDKDYWDRPQWERDLFFLIPFGKDENHRSRFIRIPVPFEQGLIFATAPGRFLQWAKEHRPDNLKSFPGTFLGNTVPNPMPQTAQVLFADFLSGAKGWDVWRGSQVVPESIANLPPDLQWTEQTSLTARKIGGFLNYSPMKVDHIIAGTTGGLGRQIVHQGIDRVISAATGEERTAVNTAPGMRFFTTPAGISSEAVTQFYDRLGVMREEYQRQKLESKKKNGREPVALSKMEEASRQMAQFRKQAHAAKTDTEKQKFYLKIRDKAMESLPR